MEMFVEMFHTRMKAEGQLGDQKGVPEGLSH